MIGRINVIQVALESLNIKTLSCVFIFQLSNNIILTPLIPPIRAVGRKKGKKDE